jgi:hypothetical protein
LKLITPDGVRISVSDDKGEALLKQGYRLVEEETPPPAEPDKPPRRKPKKA